MILGWAMETCIELMNMREENSVASKARYFVVDSKEKKEKNVVCCCSTLFPISEVKKKC